MDSIFYLLRKNVKNGIVDTFRHPMKLIVYGLIAASIVAALIRGFTMEVDVSEMLDRRILYGSFLALLYFISIPIMLKGLSTGSTFFTMGDVNNFFVSPISPKKILIYGIGKQLATSLFLVVCFSAYGSMALKMFDLSAQSALLLVGGIALMLFVGIPIPGTGAWSGALGASLIGMRFRDAMIAIFLGVIMAGIIMATASYYGFNLL